MSGTGNHGRALPFLAAVNDSSVNAWLDALQKAMPAEQVCRLEAMSDDEIAECEVAIVANPDPAALARLPRLRWVHSVWAGVERLLESTRGADLRIVRLVDPQLAQTMAEAVLTWTLYLHREGPTYQRQQSQRVWRASDHVKPQQRTVGILGLGALGSAAARVLCQANFRVLGWSREPVRLQGVETFAGADQLPRVLEQSDIVVCLLPLTPDTCGLLNHETFGQLRAGASFINFARAAIVDDAALRSALDTGRLGHAVLDVFHEEPLPASAWQWTHERVTVLPHCSGPTDRVTASAIVAENIARFRRTGEIPEGVDRRRGY